MIESIYTSQNISLALISILMLFSALCVALPVHEWAHAFVAYKQGDPTAKSLGRMTLAPHAHIDFFGVIFLVIFGFGWAKPVPVDNRNLKHGKGSEIMVALAGVFANLIVGIFFIFVSTLIKKLAPNYATDWGYYGFALKTFLSYVISINFILLFFNILPIYPLDGFRVVESLTKPNNSFVDFMRRYSWLILVILLALTYAIDYYLQFFAGNTIYGITWLFEKMFGLI